MTAQLPPMGGYRKCGKPDCLRKVKPGIAFCCGPCATAANGRHEIHEHSEWCNERAAQRGDYAEEDR